MHAQRQAGPANSPTSAMPYLAKEFTEIWWWMVVFQQRSDCLKDNEPNVSWNLWEEITQGVCIYTRELTDDGNHSLPVTLWVKNALSLTCRPDRLNFGGHITPTELIKALGYL